MIPVSLALVATSYQGVARATAIGLAYGAYGAAGGVAPILLQLVPGNRAPAFSPRSSPAPWPSGSRAGPGPGPRPADHSGTPVRRRERPIWAFGIIAFTVGITWLGGGWDNPVRWALIIGGLAVLVLAVIHDRRRTRLRTGPIRIERRPVAVAIFVGIVIAVAQTAPMLQLPLYFHLVLGYGPLLAVVAIAPLFAALVLAGPVAGFLLGALLAALAGRPRGGRRRARGPAAVVGRDAVCRLLRVRRPVACWSGRGS